MGLRAPNPILVDQGRLPGGGDILPSPKELVTISHVEKSWNKGYLKDLGNSLCKDQEITGHEVLAVHSCLCTSRVLRT